METQQALWATCANLFDHPHSKKVPDYVKMDFPVFLFVHVASCPVILNHCKVFITLVALCCANC